MLIEQTLIPGVVTVQPARHGDARGYFSETFRHDKLAPYLNGATFVQDNQSLSERRGVFRGLHFQSPPSAQGKLVRVLRGSIQDVAVDIRQGSPTYGQHVSVVLSADNWLQLWVPPGFAHGFVTLEPATEVVYKVTSYYDPAEDRGLAYNDPGLGIEWMVDPSEFVVSEKDGRQPQLKDLPQYFA
jgi:dTDP-4-dehydrorhamnose 3,5-epimerase